ncbi:adrenodoxin reductase, putative [Plasmodium vinckei brucechwatti]|uniref:Adrenodoxin reductase, putative n=1 Tax=Plasmodium vinckei brucechwatti TaxID=119398 RepID=A0A6V7S4Y6_PLAVN|nr:adrenodoxin reductase, putative [Plasmodium vinckei brucechwatti]
MILCGTLYVPRNFKNIKYRKIYNFVFFRKDFFSSENKHFKIGIIGGGPSALYCCKYFLKNEKIKVDIFDKLPNPYGLIRYGVAPDHINVKNIYKTFNSVVINKRYRFFGNVNIGVDIKVEELRNYYNAILFCCGASEPSFPQIPYAKKIDCKENEHFPDIFHARDLIYFYNNYYDDIRCKKIDNYLNSFENFSNSVIIGNGNVSLDIARILIKSIDELNKTDINNNYLNSIKRHRINHVYIIGRRGYKQTSFTNAELRELFSLDNTKVILNKNNYDMCTYFKDHNNNGNLDEDHENSNMRNRQNKLFLNMVQNYQELEKNKDLYNKYKIIEFIFCHQIKNIDPINDHIKNIEFEINKNFKNNENNNTDWGYKKSISTPLLIYATGFKKNMFSENLYNQSIQKYKEDILKNNFGIFRAGWFSNGPKGNIASQIISSKNSALTISNFLEKTTTFFDNDITDLLNKKKIQFLTFDNWNYIQNLEQNGITPKQRPGKFSTISEILGILNEKK